MNRPRFGALLLVISLLLAACQSGAPAQPAARVSQPAPDSAPPAQPKRVVTGVLGTPFTFSTLLSVGGTGTSVPGTSEMEQFVNVGFTTLDSNSRRVARLVEEVPSTDNGRWKILPDGRMEMTFTLRPGITWHDGTPLTSDDILFTAAIGQDRELPIVRPQIYEFVERIEAPDARTIVVYWKQPHIEADTIFAVGGTYPLPKHLLAEAAQNKQTFTALPYWSGQFVGVGPYRIKEWSEGSHAIVESYDRYFLGRPKINEIEVKFIPAPTTMLANILAGTVDLTMGRGLSLEQGQELQRQWSAGHIDGSPGTNPLSLRPQHLNPDPAILGDVRFRQALYHGINRQDLVDTLMGGFSVVAHHPIPPGEELLQEAAARAVKYDYDPRRSMQMLEGMGLTRAGDGFYRDASGQRIQVELRRAGDDDMEEKTILASADFWNRLGIAAEPISVPPARQRDLEYRAKFPGFEISGSGAGVNDIRYIRQSELRLAETGWNGRNRTGYANPELDALSDRYLVTIPIAERNQVLGQIVQYLTERVIIMYLFFERAPTPVANRLVNVSNNARQTPVTWNAHEWDLR
jgi:peptide/nickel transport system substrate-binding protein